MTFTEISKSAPKPGQINARVAIYRPKIVNGVEVNRERLWRYCKRVAGQSAHRARRLGVPHNITAHYIDELIVQQLFHCAVSGLHLDMAGNARGPFSPSLDRVVPAHGYVEGNVRIVCEIVNAAMNCWGIEPLERLVEAMSMRRGTKSEDVGISMGRATGRDGETV